jgi:hypothetical protein
METKINIAAILKDKPQGTKLYDWLHNIDVELDTISTTDTETVVWCTNETNNNTTCHRGYSEFGTERGYPDGLQILFPSKEMRDWTKFSWKKGDVLVNSRGLKILFDRWANDNYTSFYAKTINLVEDGFLDTNLHTLVSEKEAKSFIKCIEEKLGGKLNRETLEIEKTQPEFKDGDIVFMKGIKDGYFANCIFILRSEYKDGDERAFYYAFYNADDKFTTAEYGYTRVHYSLRPATDSEKQQLFDALAKKGKRWNSEKKQIVDLKPAFDELKPFDNVLVRHQKTEEWRANIFSHTDKTDEYLDYVCVNGRWEFCIPYEGNESLLGTTKDVEG